MRVLKPHTNKKIRIFLNGGFYFFQSQIFQKKLSEILDGIEDEQPHLHSNHFNKDENEQGEIHDKHILGLSVHSIPVHEMKFPQLFVY